MRNMATTYLAALVILPCLAQAACECGYAANITSTQVVFTDLIETDFTKVKDIQSNTDWVRQEFNKTNKNARGPLGEKFMPTNVASVHEGSSSFGLSSTKADAGLQLLVESSTVDGLVPVAEIDSARNDLHYGSFRAMMKVPDVAGTCAAFFWYHNDTQEIDIEFLTREFNPENNTYPANIVLQSRASMEKGYDAAGTGNFVKVNLGFNPTTDFHEYRIDYLRDQVIFYADNKMIGRMNGSAVPTDGGHLILQHWSNGNPLWSGGPPKKDAILTVASVKAYFNSSLDSRRADHLSRCVDPSAPDAICNIPDVTSFFFSAQTNMTNNQTVSGQSGHESHSAQGDQGSQQGVASLEAPSWSLVVGFLLLNALFF
ncbi:glycoside hydrolase family 16 protein [Colletotrichum truncatum]|uniref:Glycoside hydrolase family 16 protein n=1 Tax=Colletotrichum truncatum TaxID=5467 RepID=A0ACC3YFZ7_COLTU|nr:glycoside hydrolase family 16 protein [Colletotrichum truncatum]KAF6784547.1 glycoside hydrolase family 16 protein [Colletotrichum truncatum]